MVLSWFWSKQLAYKVVAAHIEGRGSSLTRSWQLAPTVRKDLLGINLPWFAAQISGSRITFRKKFEETDSLKNDESP